MLMRKYLCICLMCMILFGLVGCGEQQEETHKNDTETLIHTVAEQTTEAVTTVAMTEETEELLVMEEEESIAVRIDERYAITIDGTDITAKLGEKTYYQMNAIGTSQKLMIASEIPFGSLYVKWYTHPGPFTLVWEGGSMTCGTEGFLHDYIRLPSEMNAVEFVFQSSGDVAVSEISLFSQGIAPEGVQDWLEPCANADILVFPTHADDDALFFGAVISYYAIEKGLAVQSAFLTNHSYELFREHERLDGLWEMGVRHYPIIGPALDYYAGSLENAYYFHRNDDILEWQVQQIRRFKPLVILGHDQEGEYGHKQHILNTQYLIQAVELAADSEQFSESARQYGVWDTPKLYLHLYEENQLIFDVNIPMENDSEKRSPLVVAEAAYRHHISQQRLNYFKVSQKTDSPIECTRFGLFRTTVGYDTGNDLLENAVREVDLRGS